MCIARIRRVARRRIKRSTIVLAVAASLPAFSPHVQATSRIWTGGGTTANWSDTGNWGGSSPPGSTSNNTNSGDTATFHSAVGSNGGNATNPIVITSGLNILGITFDTSAGAYYVGSTVLNHVNLTSGGSILLGTSATSFTGTNTTETVNAPLILEPSSNTTAGTYSFTNNSTTASDTLNFGGGITGGTTSSTITLSLGGANIGTNTISGNIGNGSASGGLSVAKSGAGNWILSGNDSYTGTTTIGGGSLLINGTTSGQGNYSFGTLAANTTLGGSGTIGLAASNTVNVTGTGGSALAILNPGAAGAKLSITGTSASANSVVFGANSELLINASGSSAGEVVVNGQISGASNSALSFSGVPTAGNYVVLTDTGSGLATAFGTVSNIPTGYHVVGNTAGSLAIDLTHVAAISIIPAGSNPTNVHVGSNSLGVTVANGAPTGSDSLFYGLTTPLTGDSIGLAAGSNETKSGLFAVVAGPQSFSITATPSGANAPSPVSTSLSVTGYNLAAASTIPSTVSLGNVHIGGTFGTSPLSISNAGPAGSLTEGLDASASPSGSATSNGSFTNWGVGSPNTSISVGLGGSAHTGLAGAVSGSVAVSLTSNPTIDGLSATPLTAQTVSVSGNVYSGQSTWGVDSSGSWGTLASSFGTNWGANQGSPGLDASYATTDSATFGSAASSVNPTVSLDGASPSLNAITFSNASHNYNIARGAGSGTLTLTAGGSGASITDLAGSHTISAPVILGDDITVNVASSSQVAVTGGISGSGKNLNKTGSGVLTVSNTNTVAATTVTGGTLNVTGSLGTTSLDVLATSTLAGNGTVIGGLTEIHSGGILAPSAGLDGPITGSLTLEGGLKLDPASTSPTVAASEFLVKLKTASSYDNVIFGTSSSTVSATLTNVTLAVDDTGASVHVNDEFWILTGAGTNDSISGQFAGIADGAHVLGTTGDVTYQVNYFPTASAADPFGVGSAVELTTIAVPEPASLTLFGVAAIGLLARRRRWDPRS